MVARQAEARGRSWSCKGVSRFHGQDVLGRGSLGVVYRVHDAETDQEIALKTLPRPDADRVYHIKEEFRSLAGLAHPNLVELYELVVEHDQCFFTMELIDGVPFTEYAWAAVGPAFRPSSAAGITGAALQRLVDALAQLVRGLCYLHGEGKVHRDIKPSNVMVTRTGRVVLLDFDMAAHIPADGPEPPYVASFAGTPEYMAPEQLWGAVPSPAADWYGVGALLFETLSGRLPFDGLPIDASMRREPPSLSSVVPGVPAPLDDLVRALLRPDPAERAGVTALLDAIRGLDPAAAEALEGTTTISGSPPFIGREREMRALTEALARVGPGSPAVVCVEGTSGMGKTELVRRFLRSVSAGGRVLVLKGACHPQESLPYKAFDGIMDELSRYLISLPSARVAELVPQHAAALVRLFPVLGRVEGLAHVGDTDLTAAEPHELRRAGLAALRGLLAGLGAAHPLVLWIDDLQWGDADSGPLFRDLLAGRNAPGLMVVFSYRSEERDRIALLDDLKSAGLAASPVIVEVVPLDLGERIDLARALIASPAPIEPLVRELAEESSGSPFSLVELARHVVESPAILASGVPLGHRLGQILERRVEQLHESARHLLEIVAVAGRPMDRTLLVRAARLGAMGRLDLSRLNQLHLLRYTEIDDRPAVTTYHDRIRQAVLAKIPAERRRAHHLRLAEVLREERPLDLDALVEHHVGAGDARSAYAFAVSAAARAESALKFERAAELYRLALRNAAAGTPTWRLRERLAEALANAGRGREAAEAYEAAARELEPGGRELDARRLELTRCAAEQYLRSGHVDEGVAALARVLRAVDMKYPASPLRAFLTMLFNRQILWLRGLRFEPSDPSTVAAADLSRIEACWSAGLGVAWVDRMRAAAFQAQFTRLALRAGTAVHVARALATEASQRASFGGAENSRESAAIIRDARRLSESTGDPGTRAFTALMEGTMAFYDARWRAAHTLCRSAEQLLRERAGGAAWERTTGHLLSLASLVYLGDFGELDHVLPLLLREADERGDRLAASTLATGLPNLLWLAADDPGEARRRVDAASSLWGQSDFQVPHYFDLVARMHIDLYEGNGSAALTRIRSTWPKLLLSFSMLVQHLRMTVRHLRARAAIAAATEAPRVTRWRLLRRAGEDARQIEAEDVRWAAPLAAGLRAGIAAVEGRERDAAMELDRAARLYAGIEMALHAAAARTGHGVLMGGDTGRALVEESEAWMRGQGIVRPRRMAAVLLPGVPRLE